MAVLQDININVHGQPSEKRLQTFLRLSQNENGRMINFRVLGAPLPSGCTATFSGTKPDGNVYSTTGTVAGNFVMVQEDMQMTAVAGVWDATLDVVNGTHNIVTAIIRVIVERGTVAPGSVPSNSQLDGYVAQCKSYAEQARMEAYGSPLTAETKAQMTDHKRAYVYTGSEPNMVAGNWYYWNGSAWTSGGVYNAVAVQTDKTLTVKDKAADGKATGDALNALKEDLNSVSASLDEHGILPITYNPVEVITEATIDNTGHVVGTAGYNVYVFAVSAGKHIKVTGGYIYACYSVIPTKTTGQSIDEVSHNGHLNNTEITIPTGASYIAIRYANTDTGIPTVVSATAGIDQTVNELVADVADVQSFINTTISFEESGFINSSGRFVSNANYKATDYLPVTTDGTYIPLEYRVKAIQSVQFAFYDGEKAFIKAIELTTSSSLAEVTGILPYVSGAVYVRLCTYTGNNVYTDYYAKYSTVKNTVTGIIPYTTDYQGSEISVFNKILCIGDSLTSGTFNYRVGSSTSNYIEDSKYSYPTYLKKMTGCDTTNLGNGGKTSLEWYQMHSNDDLSGYDCAIIQLGVNDVGRYGTWGQDSIDGFSGIISKLKSENKNIKIFVSNIIPARSYHTDAYIAMSDAIKTYITGLDDPQVILLDMQAYGHTYDSAAYNCGHLSALGYQRLAQDYKSYISYHIMMHKTAFKEVQFIGTDYYYDPIA